MKLLKNMKIRTVFILLACVLLLVAAAGGYYILRVYQIRESGIKLSPSRSFTVRSVEYYLQNDPLWSADKIGGSNQSLGGAGCLISCASSAITALGVEITPSELNQKLTGAGGFEGADLIWYKVNEAIPQVTYKYSRVFTSKTIERDLEEGLLPVVNVRYRGGGVSHWVLIIGAADGDFLIYDPLNKDKGPLPLSAHGNVYSYRVFLPMTWPGLN